MVTGCPCDYHREFYVGGVPVCPNAFPVLLCNQVLKVWLSFSKIVGFNFPLVTFQCRAEFGFTGVVLRDHCIIKRILLGSFLLYFILQNPLLSKHFMNIIRVPNNKGPDRA